MMQTNAMRLCGPTPTSTNKCISHTNPGTDKCREQLRKSKTLGNVTDRTNYENDAVSKTLEKGEPDLSSRFDCM